MDLLIVLDSSGSVRDQQVPNTTDNWLLQLEFVKDVLRMGSKIGHYHDRVALIEFSSQAELVFDFDQYGSLDEILAAIDRLPFIGLTTNTSHALDLGREVFASSSYGSRPNATHIMLLVTDLYEEPYTTWRSEFLLSVAKLRNVTDIHRFS